MEVFKSLACADSVSHVPEVVGIAISVNLLLPVASSFLKCFLDGLEIDPEKIVEKFDNPHVTTDELTEIAVAAQSIETERCKSSPLAWGWWVADIISASTGIALLLSGLADRKIGLLCLLLFLPACSAVGWSIWRYVGLRRNFLAVVKKVKEQVAVRKKSESAYVRNYVNKCNKTLRKRKKSMTCD